jgi:hypothetical protein
MEGEAYWHGIPYKSCSDVNAAYMKDVRGWKGLQCGGLAQGNSAVLVWMPVPAV